MDKLLEFFQNIKTKLQSLSTPQKIFYTGSLAVLIGSLAFLFYTVNRVDYAPLYTKMSEEDLGSVVDALKAKKIPYQLTSAHSISVPKDRLYEVRLALATDGVLKGSGVGFEIFDQQKLGSTDFVQKINYQRALQGELSRTINRLNQVEESRVHLVIPSESLFVEDQKQPSAAVVVKLRPGAKLAPQEVQGIVNLVCSAVQGLNDDKVTVLSTDGHVLFKKNAGDDSLQMSNVQMQYKTNVENDLRNKVLAMLDPVVGANRAVARVSTDIDFSNVKVSEDRYDPDSSVIRSQQRSTETTNGGEIGAKGNPDVPINVESKLMQTPSKEGGPQQKTASRQKETVNYEISHTTRQITQTPGNIKKISVAVIVDGPYEMKPDSTGKQVPTFVGRTPQQIKTLEDIVRKAVGYNEARGDQITVTDIPFVTDGGGGETQKTENQWVRLLKENQRLIFNLLLTLLAFFFIVRPFMKKFQKLGEEPKALPEPEEVAALPEAEAEAAEEAKLLEAQADRASLRKQAIALVQQNPEHATAIIRAMMREEA